MFADSDPCPCESGHLVRDCECKARGFVPPTAETTPPPPITGLRVSGCYASALNDCRPPLSAEHPLSLGVIEQLSGNANVIGVSGRPWQRDPSKVDLIGLHNVTKKVLCRRHNSALSQLDGLAVRFVRGYADAMIHLTQGLAGEFHRLFNGFDLERWMLKVICALQFGEAIPGSGNPTPWQVPLRWLDVLFDKAELPQGAGLYMAKRPVHRPNGEFMIYTERSYLRFSAPKIAGLPIVGVRPIKILAGIRIALMNLELELYMTRPLNRKDYVYRPRMIRFPDQDLARTAFIHLGWDKHPPTFAGKLAFRNEFGFSERGARRALVRKEGLARKKKK